MNNALPKPSTGWRDAIFYSILTAVFACWFGGFTFYAAVVVPIGTDILESARAQGEITQRVVNFLHMLGLVAVALMYAEHRWYRAPCPTQDAGPGTARQLNLGIICTLFISCLALITIKHFLDGLIEPTQSSIRVTDRDRFYLIHQVYLLTSTAQWLLHWFWLILLARFWTTRTSNQSSKEDNLVKID